MPQEVRPTSSPHSTSHDAAVHNTAAHNKAVHNAAAHNKAVEDKAAHSTAVEDTAAHNTAVEDTAVDNTLALTPVHHLPPSKEHSHEEGRGHPRPMR